MLWCASPASRDACLPGSNWGEMAESNSELVGYGQWKNCERPPITPDLGKVPKEEGLWQIFAGGQWRQLTSNEEVLHQIEADYCAGRSHLCYSHCYRQECGCLGSAKTCPLEEVVTGVQDENGEYVHGVYRPHNSAHLGLGNRSHIYYVEFAQTVRICPRKGGPTKGAYARQIDITYPLDPYRWLPVRRVPSKAKPLAALRLAMASGDTAALCALVDEERQLIRDMRQRVSASILRQAAEAAAVAAEGSGSS